VSGSQLILVHVKQSTKGDGGEGNHVIDMITQMASPDVCCIQVKPVIFPHGIDSSGANSPGSFGWFLKFVGNLDCHGFHI
jgi:hypothetical protein